MTWGGLTTSTGLPPKGGRESAAETLHRVTTVPGGTVPVTVGRMLHYVPDTVGASCHPAIVTAVHSTECLDLVVFASEALAFRRLVLHAGVGPRPGYDSGVWHWPEYSREATVSEEREQGNS
jgi:hypothetical protein